KWYKKRKGRPAIPEPAFVIASYCCHIISIWRVYRGNVTQEEEADHAKTDTDAPCKIELVGPRQSRYRQAAHRTRTARRARGRHLYGAQQDIPGHHSLFPGPAHAGNARPDRTLAAGRFRATVQSRGLFRRDGRRTARQFEVRRDQRS